MEGLFNGCHPLSGAKKAPSWALGAGGVPALHRTGHCNFLLDGILKHLILFRDVLPVIDFLEGIGPREHIALGREGAALVDGGVLPVGFIIEIIQSFLRELNGPQLVDQPASVFFRVLDGVKLAAVQVIGEVD